MVASAVNERDGLGILGAGQCVDNAGDGVDAPHYLVEPEWLF